MLKIYHVTGTRGTRVIWLCEELGLEYEVTTIDFSAAFRATEEWRALNPVGKVPVLTDGETTLFESGAMLEYILDRYGEGGLVPPHGTTAYAQYQQWLWFAEATFSRPLGEIVNHRREFPGDAEIPEVVEEMKRRAALCAEAVAEHMQGRTYLLGDTFSAADIMMGYTISLVEMLAPEYMPEGLQPYWALLQTRPAFQTARAA